jgi:replicative DNA helicase
VACAPLATSTGAGTTALAAQIALHVVDAHESVVLVSMETDVDLGARLVSVLTNIKKEQRVIGALSEPQRAQAHQAAERVVRSNLYMVYGSGYTTGDVRAHLYERSPRNGSSRRSWQSTMYTCSLMRKAMADGSLIGRAGADSNN